MHIGNASRRWVTIAAWLLLIAASFCPASQGAEGRPPNLVLILADDLGYGDLGCYGHPKFKTPRLDRMASEGARFAQFVSPASFCAPTRAAILTGRHPLRCGMTANPAPDGGPQADAVALPASEVTLAEILRRSGYATGMVGKWHLGHRKPEQLPTRRGFDEYFGILYSNDMRPVQVRDGEKVAEDPAVQSTLTARYTERALGFIERSHREDKPFFLYFAHAMPHKPLAASEGFAGKSGAGLYGDVMSELDGSVGLVLDKLGELGIDDDTLVVFASDNGPWFGGSTGGLRGMKGTSWEGGYRVPCLARWPGKVKPGQVRDELSTVMDLFATFLAAARAEPPRDRKIDGVDLLPLLAAGQGAAPHESVVGLQGARPATIRDARWKLHVLPARERPFAPKGERWIDPRGPDGKTILAPPEQYQPEDYPGLRTGDEPRAMGLFDLAADPGEQHDIAAEHPEIVARLKARFDEAARDLAAPRTQADRRLIEWGWDEPDTAFMRAHIAEMEKAPFDGLVFHVVTPAGASFTWEGWGARRFEPGDFAHAVADLKATPFGRFAERFLRVNVAPGDVDWCDDRAWKVVLHNARIAAGIVRAGGCRGIMFDVEQYQGHPWEYARQQHREAKSFDDYRAVVRRRGGEWIRAINAEAPEITILLTFGYAYAQPRPPQRDRSEAPYGLLADFLDGALESCTAGTTFVDAWEQSYPYKAREQFAAAYATIKDEAPAWSAVPEAYRKHMRAGFGLWMDYNWRNKGWDVEDPSKNHFAPGEFGVAVRAALDVSDRYAWIYTEQPRWWPRSKLPAAYAEAIAAARGASEGR